MVSLLKRYDQLGQTGFHFNIGRITKDSSSKEIRQNATQALVTPKYRYKITEDTYTKGGRAGAE